jgi:FkbM family methyltransferase
MGLRSIAERLSRGRTVWRRLPTRVGGGRVLLSPESALQYWHLNLDRPACSQLLFDFAVRFVGPRSVVWDVGANCGVFAFAAAGLSGPGGRVLAVEPDRFLNGLIRRTASAMPATSAAVDVIGCAVTDCVGTGTFHIASRGRSTNFLDSVTGRPDAGGVRFSEVVPTATLDSLTTQFPLPDVLKIDVEGAEALVLRGAARMLRRCAPVILCEVGDATRSEVTAGLENLGYSIVPAERSTSRTRRGDSANLLAVPRRAP